VLSVCVVCVVWGCGLLYIGKGGGGRVSKCPESASTPPHRPPLPSMCRHELARPRRWPRGRGRTLSARVPGWPPSAPSSAWCLLRGPGPWWCGGLGQMLGWFWPFSSLPLVRFPESALFSSLLPISIPVSVFLIIRGHNWKQGIITCICVHSC
jgi:hypothetical protein